MTVTDKLQTIVLTGATGGLGHALVTELARRRPRQLILVGRSRSALADTARRARHDGARSVRIVEADLADLASVASAAHEVRTLVADAGAPITSMVLNAGVQLTDRRHASAQGHESTFAVNVASSHLLLRSLLPATETGARAVLVSSGTHFGDWHSYGMVPRPDWRDPAELARPDAGTAAIERGSGGRAYSTSKLAVIYLAHAWNARFGDRIRVNAFDPGLMPGTGLARDLDGPSRWAWAHVLPALTFLPGWSTPARSAKPLAALAVGASLADAHGVYVEASGIHRSSKESYDVEREARLWDVLEGLVGPWVSTPATA